MVSEPWLFSLLKTGFVQDFGVFGQNSLGLAPVFSVFLGFLDVKTCSKLTGCVKGRFG